jgi:hypothetical protein
MKMETSYKIATSLLDNLFFNTSCTSLLKDIELFDDIFKYPQCSYRTKQIDCKIKKNTKDVKDGTTQFKVALNISGYDTQSLKLKFEGDYLKFYAKKSKALLDFYQDDQDNNVEYLIYKIAIPSELSSTKKSFSNSVYKDGIYYVNLNFETPNTVNDDCYLPFAERVETLN